MIDIEKILKDGPPQKGAFLSRVFGIFNEEIIRIWARDERCKYNIAERRPTLYDAGKHYTLDFLLERNGLWYVSEMKCEIQYQNYKYWRLVDPEQLEHHKRKRAFQLFLALSANCDAVPVKAGQDISVAGTVLVWGAASSKGIAAVRERYGITDVVTVEGCISDLLSWRNTEFQAFVEQRESWMSSLFNELRAY